MSETRSSSSEDFTEHFVVERDLPEVARLRAEVEELEVHLDRIENERDAALVKAERYDYLVNNNDSAKWQMERELAAALADAADLKERAARWWKEREEALARAEKAEAWESLAKDYLVRAEDAEMRLRLALPPGQYEDSRELQERAEKAEARAAQLDWLLDHGLWGKRLADAEAVIEAAQRLFVVKSDSSGWTETHFNGDAVTKAAALYRAKYPRQEAKS